MAERGKVVAITGAASGIGRATALGFGRQGARVALCDMNATGATEVAAGVEKAGGSTRVVRLDVSDPAQATVLSMALCRPGDGSTSWSMRRASTKVGRRAMGQPCT